MAISSFYLSHSSHGELTNSATYFADPIDCQYHLQIKPEENSPFSDSLWVFVFALSLSADMFALFSPFFFFVRLWLKSKMLMFCLVGGGIVGSASPVASFWNLNNF